MRAARTSFGSACFLWVALGCGGAGRNAAPPMAPLPDQEPAPARVVPKASTLVKDGEKLLQSNDPKGAQALFEKAIAEDPNDARAELDLGITREAQGDAKGAEIAYRRAIELQADLAEALNNLAVLLRERGDIEEAVPLLEKAAQANPKSAAAQTNLALALEEQKDLVGAERAYRAAIALDEANAMTRANLGLMLVGKGDLQAARVELRSALGKAAGNRAALLAIGNGLRRAEDAPGALQAMQGAVSAEKDVTAALLSELALAQRAADDRDGAIATLESALVLDAKYATAHYLLGNMLAGAARFDEAKKHYERYLQLEPKGDQAEQARGRLAALKKARKK